MRRTRGVTRRESQSRVAVLRSVEVILVAGERVRYSVLRRVRTRRRRAMRRVGASAGERNCARATAAAVYLPMMRKPVAHHQKAAVARACAPLFVYSARDKRGTSAAHSDAQALRGVIG